MFKKGDWVKGPNGDIWQLSSTPDPGSYVAEECALWQPQLNEWCWFWCKDDTIPTLDKFKSRTGSTNYMTATNGYPYCEPFIGQLPSFLKD